MIFLAAIGFSTTVLADTPLEAHFLKEVSHTESTDRQQLKFVFLSDDGTVEQALLTLEHQTSKTGFDVVILVRTLNHILGQSFRTDLHSRNTNRTIIDALEIHYSANSLRHSLIVLFPEENAEHSYLQELGTHLQSLGLNADNSSNAALEWLESKDFPEREQPICFFAPESSVGESRMEIIQAYEKLSALKLRLVGFPTFPAGSILEDANLYDQVLQGRDFAWNQLTGVYGINVNAALSIDRNLTQEKTVGGRQQSTWLVSESGNTNEVLHALESGNFFVESNGIVEGIKLTVDSIGLPRPATIGEEIFVPAGKEIQVKLICEVPSIDHAGDSNWLDSLELVVISNGEVNTLAESSIHVGKSEQVWDLTVPESGLFIRGVARRFKGSETDDIAYSNGIRIHSKVAEKEWEFSEALPEFPLSKILKYLAAGIAVLIAITLLRKSLRRRNRKLPIRRSKQPLRASKAPARSSDSVDWSPPLMETAEVETVHVSSSTVQDQIPFLTREHIVLAAIVGTVCVVYGLFVPLKYRPIELEDAFEKFSEIRYLNIGLQGRQDWVANLLLFIPLGFLYCGSMILDRRSLIASRIIGFVISGVLLTTLAVLTEFLQLWFPPRTVSQNDIIAETIGGLAGSLLAVLFFQPAVSWTRKLISRANLDAIIDWFLYSYLGALLIVQLMPFDFVLNMEELRVKFSNGLISTNPFPQSKAQWISFVASLCIYLPVGFWTNRVRFMNRQPDKLVSILFGITVVIVYELLQVPVFSRSSNLQNVIAGSTGALVGALFFNQILVLFRKIFSIEPRKDLRRAMISCSLSIIYLACIAYIYKGHTVRGTDGETMLNLQRFWQVPFARLYWGTELNAFFVIARQILLLLPVGFLLADAAMSCKEQGSLKFRLLSVALFLSISASSLEIAQAWSEENFSDITDALLLTFGGIVGMGLRCIILDFTLFGLNQESRRLVTSYRLLGWSLFCIIGVAGTGYAGLHLVRGITNQGLQPEKRIQLVVDSIESSDSLKVENIVIPTPDTDEAIWGATGTDSEGNIWIGISDGRDRQASARILKLEPAQGRLIEVTNVLAELRKHGLIRPDDSQSKIHSKFIQADDGFVYFSSMDELGEKSDGSQLPTWGSHLWKIHPKTYQTEHLAAVPEGLIAISGAGRWIYALGLFDHVLYQWDTQTRELKRKTVGSIGGHISRNIISDRNGHVYVPRLKFHGDAAKSPANPSADSSETLVELVQFDSNLQEIASFPLEHYLSNSYWTNHGITGICRIVNGAVLFTTSSGRLYRVFPSATQGKSTLQDVGWFHPDGSAYAPSLFALSDQTVGGVVSKNGKYEWVEFNLSTYQAIATPLPIPESVNGPHELLLYGSESKDEFGSTYLVGKKYGTPIVLRVSKSNDL